MSEVVRMLEGGSDGREDAQQKVKAVRHEVDMVNGQIPEQVVDSFYSNLTEGTFNPGWRVVDEDDLAHGEETPKDEMVAPEVEMVQEQIPEWTANFKSDSHADDFSCLRLRKRKEDLHREDKQNEERQVVQPEVELAQDQSPEWSCSSFHADHSDKRSNKSKGCTAKREEIYQEDVLQQDSGLFSDSNRGWIAEFEDSLHKMENSKLEGSESVDRGEANEGSMAEKGPEVVQHEITKRFDNFDDKLYATELSCRSLRWLEEDVIGETEDYQEMKVFQQDQDELVPDYSHECIANFSSNFHAHHLSAKEAYANPGWVVF